MSERESQVPKFTTPHANAASTAASAPEMQRKPFSFKRVRTLAPEVVEGELGLPAGAFRRRRLLALKALAGSDSSIAVRKGDCVVVEPGCQVGDGQLVVVRNSKRLDLRWVDRDAGARGVLVFEEPGALGLTIAVPRHQILGKVIGVLSGFGSNADSPAAQATNQGDERKSAFAPTVLVPEALRIRNRASLDRTREVWGAWLAANPADDRPRRARERQRLTRTLRILSECLDQTAEAHLYAALVHQVNVAIKCMRRETRPAAVELPCLDTPPTLVAAGRAPSSTKSPSFQRDASNPRSGTPYVRTNRSRSGVDRYVSGMF